MARKPIVTTFVLITTLFAASVFGGDLASLVEKIPSMFVTNDDAHAVPVRDLNDPGRHAFAFFTTETIDEGAGGHTISFQVPEGKRLVVDSLGTHAALPGGQTLTHVAVRTEVNGTIYFHVLGPTFQGTVSGGRSIFVGSQQTTFFADGGTTVQITAVRTANTGEGTFSPTLAGHLIDCEVGVCK